MQKIKILRSIGLLLSLCGISLGAVQEWVVKVPCADLLSRSVSSWGS